MPETPETSAEISKRLRRRQGWTITSLTLGYAAYYVCRSNLSVASPLMLEEFGPALTKTDIGTIASVGTFVYALGKTVNGIATEYLGGKQVFIGGMIFSVLCTIAFLFSAYLLPPGRAHSAMAGTAIVSTVQVPWISLMPLFLIWGLNRYVQSMGWGGLVSITAHWFSPARMATVMGTLSMSYLLGDALARLYLGTVIKFGGSWEDVFVAAAVVLGLVALFCQLTLKNRPSELNLPEPPPPPENVYGNHKHERLPLKKLLGPLFASPVFWLVCIMNIGLTMMRETFNFWSPTYLKEVARFDSGMAGIASLIFPLVGGLSSFVAGWLVDRSGGRYSLIMIPSLVGLAIVLSLFAIVPVKSLPDGTRETVALLLISGVAVFMLAPYTFCSGVLAVRIGGQRGGSTSAGLIDTTGYLGAIVSGFGIGMLAEKYGWATAFGSLAGVALLTLAIAGIYALVNRRIDRNLSVSSRNQPQPESASE